jgi:ribosome-associated protein
VILVMMVRAFGEEEVQSSSDGVAQDAARDAMRKVPIAQSTPETRQAQRARARELAIEIARLLDENKCTDVLLLDVHGLTQVQDYIVIASGTSERQMRTCTGDIKAMVDLHGQNVYRADKDTTGTWQVIDCVDVVVHLFEPNTRGYYDLESRWGDAPRLEWERDGQKRAAKQEIGDDGQREAETFGEDGDEDAKVAVKKVATKAAAKKVTKKAVAKPAAKVAKKVAKKAGKKVAAKAAPKVAKKAAKKAVSKPAVKAAKKVSKTPAKSVVKKAAPKVAKKAGNKKAGNKTLAKTAKKASKKSGKR